MLESVYEFNRKTLRIEMKNKPKMLDTETHAWLVTALREEAEELEDARDVAEVVDALLDSVYFALGGLYRLGLSEEQAIQCFNHIHRMNMTKTPGVKPTRPQDGSVTDAVKSKYFTDPIHYIREVLK